MSQENLKKTNSISSMDEIVNQMEELVVSIKNRIKRQVEQGMNKKKMKVNQPKTLIGGELKEYQLEGLNWMVELAKSGMSGILADDMGLGKTIQTLSYIAYLQQQHNIQGKHLIVCPKNVLRNWENQAHKWTENFRVVVLPATERERQQCLQKFIRPKKFDILITTYLGCQFCEKQLTRKMHWETLIIDEAHCIKNDQTVLSSVLRRYVAKFTLLLTGTPLSNNLHELWSLLNFIMPQLFADGSLFYRIEESVNAFSGSEEQKYEHQSKVAQFFQQMIKPFMKRRTKSQLDLGLKKKSEITLFVPLSDLQLKMYRNFLKFQSVYGEGGYSLNKTMQLRKICVHPYMFSKIQDPQRIGDPDLNHLINNCGKMKVLDKLLQKFLNQNHKILIFSQFVGLLTILEDYCYFREYKYVKIDGNSSLDQRDEATKKFDKDPSVRIFLISTRAGGIGLNLISADIVILYDIDWNPQMDRQAMDRSYRIGQKNNVLVFRIISNNTIQEKMLQVQKYKLIWDELVIQKGGLASLKNSDNEFDKINHDKLATVGAEDIFKLQENFDDKDIEEIIKIGEERDREKTEQIRKKLQKKFEAYGNKLNPYAEINNKSSSNLSDIQYDYQIVHHDKNKKNISKKKREYSMSDHYHQFYDDKEAAKKLLQILQKEKNSQEIEKLRKELRKNGFYDWSKRDFEKFVQANKKYHRQNWKKINEYLSEKKISEIKQYSRIFYKRGEYELINNEKRLYNVVLRKQKQFDQKRKLEALFQKVRELNIDGLFLGKQEPLEKISRQSLNRLQFNGIIERGICKDECSHFLEKLLPYEMQKYKKNRTTYKSIKNIQKVIDLWQDKGKREIDQKRRARQFKRLHQTYINSNIQETEREAERTSETTEKQTSKSKPKVDKTKKIK